MQTQMYIFGHLSLTQKLALDIPNRVATMRDRKSAFKKKKRFFSAFKETSLFSASQKYMTELFHFID